MRSFVVGALVLGLIGCTRGSLPLADAALIDVSADRPAVDSRPPRADRSPDRPARDAARPREWLLAVHGQVHPKAVVVDADGNVYVAGSFSKSVTFGSTSVTALAGTDAFVVKLSSDGDVLWLAVGTATATTHSDHASVLALALDADGSLYVAGDFAGELKLGSAAGAPVLHAQSQHRGGFVARLAADGTHFPWAIGASASAGSTWVSGVAVHGGALAVTGRIGGQVTLGGVALATQREGDAFVARIEADGKALWATATSGPWGHGAGGDAIAVDGAGDLVMLGRFYYETSFGPVTLPTSKAGQFVARVSASTKTFLWATPIWGGLGEGGWTDATCDCGLVLDASGNAHVTGSFEQVCNFDTLNVISGGVRSAYVARLSPAGSFVDVVHSGGLDLQDRMTGSRIAIDPKGRVLFSGYLSGNNQIGNAVFSAPTGPANGLYVAEKLAPGQVAKRAAATGKFYPELSPIAVDSAGNLYVVGKIYGDTSFGATKIAVAKDAEAMFVWKIALP